ncbi:MAG: DNA methylase [Gemmiger sp.]
MAEKQRIYAAVDLKSFYASVECVSRRLDTLTTNLVVADVTRTEKTICLAVSPSLKAVGIPGRPRLFEVVQKTKEVNQKRLAEAIRQHKAVRGADGRWGFSSSSFDAAALAKDPSLELGYLVAPPRMAAYIECSTRIYQIYLKYIAPEDIHVYSIDEVFLDLTNYLPLYRMTAHELVTTMIRDILYNTGITATAGIGTNLYLAKVAMDIVAKHVPADKDGVRIAALDEQSYRQTLWSHTPLTDFWRVGRGYARRLEALGLHTMGDVALCSLGGPREYYNEELLYKTFGVNAELLIDHAWGWEPTTLADIKAYQPESHSLGSGQVLTAAYPCDKARLVLREMAEELVLSLVDKGLVTDQIDLTIGYDIASLTAPGVAYTGPVTTDAYGRRIPKHAHGTQRLGRRTQSARVILDAAMALFDRVVNPALLVRRVNIVALHVAAGREELPVPEIEQLDLFTDYARLEQERLAEQKRLERESRLQQAALSIKKKFGKNALVKGMDLQPDATAMTRNNQIGGHKA